MVMVEVLEAWEVTRIVVDIMKEVGAVGLAVIREMEVMAVPVLILLGLLVLVVGVAAAVQANMADLVVLVAAVALGCMDRELTALAVQALPVPQTLLVVAVVLLVLPAVMDSKYVVVMLRQVVQAAFTVAVEVVAPYIRVVVARAVLVL